MLNFYLQRNCLPQNWPHITSRCRVLLYTSRAPLGNITLLMYGFHHNLQSYKGIELKHICYKVHFCISTFLDFMLFHFQCVCREGVLNFAQLKLLQYENLVSYTYSSTTSDHFSPRFGTDFQGERKRGCQIPVSG